MNRIFLLSPARCDGRRARMLLAPSASFELARRVRSRTGAPIGDVFSFLSGLYFRGKLAYGRAYGRSNGPTSAYVITTDRGLVPPDALVRRGDLAAFAKVDIATAGARHSEPLRRDVERLAAEIGRSGRIVLLGSIATGRYADTLIDVLGDRVLFPTAFVGRGDMSRGGLMLRSVRDGNELEYAPIIGAARHGKRPPRLTSI